MRYKAVINMQNPNALIAMAQVSANANNPYTIFCEYIKYCIFTNATDTMTLPGIREAVGKEFGLYMPHNIVLRCLSLIEREGLLTSERHQFTRKGSFDIESFDTNRTEFRRIENEILAELVKYVANYGKTWTVEYAREQLVRVLDKSGLAYDVFMRGQPKGDIDGHKTTSISDLNELLPDDEDVSVTDIDTQPLYKDDFFVGKFVAELLAGDTLQKEYLQKICAGLMICVGAYQVPDAEANSALPQINGTAFFFDTRLLLRFVGCANEAAVIATQELVKLIQDAGGLIYYYPHTLEEMLRAFDDAITNLTNKHAPCDEEMRLYAMRINNSADVLSVKKANLQSELAAARIFLRQLETYSENERLRFGFDRYDFEQYMRKNLPWDQRTIQNDAYSIWETHMRRGGNYREYCGTQDRLGVFVTNNPRLIAISLGYREERDGVSNINGWRPNCLPVITDMRLTCRLWSPAVHNERLSLLYLSANAVAAQRPTQRYFNTVRELALQLEKEVPQYSNICLTEYFDDKVTDAILKNTMGQEENLNIGTLATTIAELSEWKAKEEEARTQRAAAERDEVSGKYGAQTQAIIDGAVEEYRNKLGIWNTFLRLGIHLEAVITILFLGLTAGVGLLTESWHACWIVLGPVIMGIVELAASSRVVQKWIIRRLLPAAEKRFQKSIVGTLRKAELQYKDEIVAGAMEKSKLLVECREIIKK